MKDYKTNKQKSPLIISIQAGPDSAYCPVKALHNYLQLFQHTLGPLFQTLDGLPITYSMITSHLRSAIQFIGLSTEQFKGHSFRIGAATHAASLYYLHEIPCISNILFCITLVLGL